MAEWTLHEGDCLSGLAELADGSVDHVITDPPYEAEAHTLQRRVKNGCHAGASFNTNDDRVSVVQPLDFAPISSEVRAEVSAHLARIARRWVLVFCQAEAVAAWRDALTASGLSYRRACIWVKRDGQPQLTGDRPGMGYESIVAAHRAGKSRWNGGGRHGVYDVLKRIGSQPNEHPTQKPIGLMEALIRDFTDSGELVCDPFAGSGTTGVASVRLGRRFVGWEKDPRYAAIARRRLAVAREQLELCA